jgi:ABC-type dipeptide/oligopeptide/nickel transport system ATPase component
MRPSLIIADEPTSALDVSVQAQILGLLQGLRQRHRVGILFISHDLAVVRNLCDRVYVLHRGEVLEHGPVETVFGSPSETYTMTLVAAVAERGWASAPAGVPA